MAKLADLLLVQLDHVVTPFGQFETALDQIADGIIVGAKPWAGIPVLLDLFSHFRREIERRELWRNGFGCGLRGKLGSRDSWRLYYAALNTDVDKASDRFRSGRKIILVPSPTVDKRKPIRRNPHLQDVGFFSYHVCFVATPLTWVKWACSYISDPRGSSNLHLGPNRNRLQGGDHGYDAA